MAVDILRKHLSSSNCLRNLLASVISYMPSLESVRRIVPSVTRFRQVAAYILAGGASSRMGRDKALLEFSGVPLIVRTFRLIEPFVAGVTIVGSPPRYAHLGLPAISDHSVADQAPKTSGGPLTGIATALAQTDKPWNLILACDLPYLTAAWVEWLLTRASPSQGQVVIPRTEHGLEPLAAVYRRECSRPMADALARGVRKVTDAIDELDLDVVHQSEWSRLDARRLIMKNMNTRADYEEARNSAGIPSGEGEHVRKRRRERKPKMRSAPRPNR